MLSRNATHALRRVNPASILTRRGFHATRAQMSSPYHYPEGPLSSLPFNPRKKGFFVKFWLYAFTGFTLPIWIAGKWLAKS